jgi:acyl dehydratase
VTDPGAIARDPVAVSEGDAAPELEVGPITRTDIVRYAGAGGDFNPIHHDEEFARSAGMPTVFAMGLMHGGMLAAHLARWLGRANIRSYRIRFTGQVWPGDELILGGRVDRVYDAAGERRADCSLQVTRGTGDDVIRASATARVA